VRCRPAGRPPGGGFRARGGHAAAWERGCQPRRGSAGTPCGFLCEAADPGESGARSPWGSRRRSRRN